MSDPERNGLRSRVDELNRWTSEGAREDFRCGKRFGFETFVREPLRTAVRSFRESPPRDRIVEAIFAGYGSFLRAAKHWELEMGWDEISCVGPAPDGTRWLVRNDVQRGLEALLLGNERGEALPGGRGGATRWVSPVGPVIVRKYLRGGAMRWMGGMHVGFLSRPFHEFRLLRAARRRGILVPEPLAAGVCRTMGLLYSGRLVMREIEGAVPLYEALAAEPPLEIFAAFGRALRRAHDAGLVHPDLNLGNVLVGRGKPAEFHFVDLDKGVLLDEPVPVRVRRRAFARLRRSARRLDPAGERIPPAAWDALVAAHDA